MKRCNNNENGQNGKLVVVNLQKTPMDKKCAIRVWGLIDDFVMRVMKLLKIEVPEWRLTRHVAIKMERMPDKDGNGKPT